MLGGAGGVSAAYRGLNDIGETSVVSKLSAR